MKLVEWMTHEPNSLPQFYEKLPQKKENIMNVQPKQDCVDPDNNNGTGFINRTPADTSLGKELCTLQKLTVLLSKDSYFVRDLEDELTHHTPFYQRTQATLLTDSSRREQSAFVKMDMILRDFFLKCELYVFGWVLQDMGRFDIIREINEYEGGNASYLFVPPEDRPSFETMDTTSAIGKLRKDHERLRRLACRLKTLDKNFDFAHLRKLMSKAVTDDISCDDAKNPWHSILIRSYLRMTLDKLMQALGKDAVFEDIKDIIGKEIEQLLCQ